MSDTIVALSTPVGRSGIGVIRLSGENSLALVRHLVNQQNFQPKPRYAHLRKIYDSVGGEVLDEAVITFFQAPKSFTGEDVFEISCHGSPVVLRRIIDFCLNMNARLADPGEFSLRALSNGRINLSQAEAIRDLIDSQTLYAVKQSIKQLEGEVSKQLQPIKEDLLDVIVILESALEFVEDDLPDYQIENITRKLEDIFKDVDKLSATYKAGRLLREGLSVAIVGRPNVGKSSLFNALLGRERAIVTDIAGTTRDQINERLSIDGIPISLIDTAGQRNTIDVVETIGVQRAKQSMSEADLVVVLLDGSLPLTREDLELIENSRDLNRLVVINKADLSIVYKDIFDLKPIQISAKTGKGLEDLKCGIVEPFLSGNAENGGFLISDARHFDLLIRTKSEINNSISLWRNNMSEEIILINLHNALNFLGQITGETTTEDMLSQIFSTFCIGK